MKISIIGTGRMGRALAKTIGKAYPGSVLFAGRNEEHTQSIASEYGLPVTVVPEADALKADIIIPTLWFADVKPWMVRNRRALKGKVLVDITNPFNEDFTDFTIGYDTSSAEEIQKLLPDTVVAGAFKNTYWVVFDEPTLQGIKSDLYVTCNNEDVLQVLIDLFKQLPFRVLHAGGLKNNRTIERMTLISGHLARKAGSHPRISFNLWGLEHEGLSSLYYI
jgi:8-hydroxy-5-deazaflavin:NADPH oxidoreductase